MAKKVIGDVVHPVYGTPMYPRPAPPEREIAKSMIDHGSQHHYATNYAAKVHEKEAEHGVLYVCPSTGYKMRVKEPA